MPFSLFSFAIVAYACRFLAFKRLALSHRYPWGAAVSLCVYNDLLMFLQFVLQSFSLPVSLMSADFLLSSVLPQVAGVLGVHKEAISPRGPPRRH